MEEGKPNSEEVLRGNSIKKKCVANTGIENVTPRIVIPIRRFVAENTAKGGRIVLILASGMMMTTDITNRTLTQKIHQVNTAIAKLRRSTRKNRINMIDNCCAVQN